MLNVATINIEKIEDYDNFFKKIPHYFKNDSLYHEIINRIGLNCKNIKIEFPFFDEDFISTYSNYYSLKHREIKKNCIKLHFFLHNEEYAGFIVLRPLGFHSKTRTKLDPRLFNDTKNIFIMSNNFKVNILGEELSVNAFPAIGQDTEISVCAHAALWTVLRYFSSKYKYRERLIADIASQVEEIGIRRTPFSGLTIYDIARVLEKNEFTPILVAKIKGQQNLFINELYSYMESGLPVIASVNQNHALTLIGHGEVDLTLLRQSSEDIIFISDFINSFIAIDDNYLPYKQITRTLDGSTKYHNFDNIDSFIVPLSEKMFLTAKIVREKVKTFLKLEQKVLNLPEKVVVRIFLTSSLSYKKFIRSNSEITSDLKDQILKVEMPKFIWVTELFIPENYALGKVSASLIIDSTAGQYDFEPWILLHDSEKVIYFDIVDGTFKGKPIKNFNIYKMYISNLDGFGEG